MPSIGGDSGICSGAPKGNVEGTVSVLDVMAWRAREAERTGLMQRRLEEGAAVLVDGR